MHQQLHSVLRITAAALCAALLFVDVVSGQGRGGRGAAAAAPAFEPKDFSGYWELPPDGHDGRNIPTPSLASNVTKQKLAAVAAHERRGVGGRCVGTGP